MRDHSTTFYLTTKRFFDVIVGSFLFVLSLPAVLLAALAIRLESPGNPFFVQKRVGFRGRQFKIFKLRGMYVDARERFPHLYDYKRYDNLDFYFHYEQDPRVTSVGKFLRRTSIDELPNFLNVITGNMTLVGPRPEIPEVLALYGALAMPYVSVKPGVTCLSKITGRDLLTKQESIEMDLEYVRGMSFALDIKILWKTMRNVISIHNSLPTPQDSLAVNEPQVNKRTPVMRDTD